jgi:type III pantothenate kinase
MDHPHQDEWLGIVVGNTHERWGWFREEKLQQVDRFPSEHVPSWPVETEIWAASVGGSRSHPSAHLITLADIPLQDLYDSLGVDRALAVLAAQSLPASPALVVDAGTALTLSGADAQGSFVGGLILPGLGLQAQALQEHTAALPRVSIPRSFPLDLQAKPWRRDTAEAIQSGILGIVIAGLYSFIQDWLAEYPESRIICTGGDGPLLHDALARDPMLAARLSLRPHLVLEGIARCRSWCCQP